MATKNPQVIIRDDDDPDTTKGPTRSNVIRAMEVIYRAQLVKQAETEKKEAA